jgi:hypothetical protein
VPSYRIGYFQVFSFEHGAEHSPDRRVIVHDRHKLFTSKHVIRLYPVRACNDLQLSLYNPCPGTCGTMVAPCHPKSSPPNNSASMPRSYGPQQSILMEQAATLIEKSAELEKRISVIRDNGNKGKKSTP